MWTNKGRDAWSVKLGIDRLDVVTIARKIGADTIVHVHNHPNPDPSHFSTRNPSAQDAIHASWLGRLCVASGMRFVAFVAERGSFYIYALWGPGAHARIPETRSKLRSLNGTSWSTNRELRSRLRQSSTHLRLFDIDNTSHNLLVKPDTSIEERIAPEPRRQHTAPVTAPEVQMPSLTAPKSRIRQGIHFVPVASGLLSSIGYDAKSQTLYIRFIDGSMFEYQCVPLKLWRSLHEAKDKGAFFERNIRNWSGGVSKVN
jgi:hypothetical protein